MRKLMYARELIPLHALNNTIKNQHIPISRPLEVKDILVFRFLDVQDVRNFEGHGLTRPLMVYFVEPAVCVR
jgi:hypothetical protein